MYLETKRTIIRDFNINDVNDLYEILSDEEVMEYIEPVNTFEQTKEFLESFCIKEKKAFAVVNKEDNKMFGYLLFKSVDDPLVYEIGWINNKNYWKKGFAYESCKCIIDYAFKEMKIHKIF